MLDPQAAQSESSAAVIYAQKLTCPLTFLLSWQIVMPASTIFTDLGGAPAVSSKDAVCSTFSLLVGMQVFPIHVLPVNLQGGSGAFGKPCFCRLPYIVPYHNKGITFCPADPAVLHEEFAIQFQGIQCSPTFVTPAFHRLCACMDCLNSLMHACIASLLTKLL